MSTYRKIKELTNVLNGTTTATVQKRRAAGKELQELMTKPAVRLRLANEAGQSILRRRGGGGRRNQQTASLRVLRRRALISMWKSIINAAVGAVEFIYQGKTKFTVGDVNMLYKLVQACDGANEGFENAYSNSKLTRNETKSVTKLCLMLLEDEDVVKIAESQLLELLAFICSSNEYVTHFRPHLEIQHVMEEAEKRIAGAVSGSISHLNIDCATKIFESLITTSSTLGITLNLIMPGSVKLVASWCVGIIKRDARENRTSRVSEQSRLLRGLCALIRSNPEQAIAPLRRHGKPILSFARRRYASADELQRDVLNEFFLCHIYVSQVAGKLQGLLTGGLGDLGDASLSDRHINQMLDLVMKSNLKQDKSDLPVTEFQSVQLELTAKLLACAQWRYVGNSEWDLLGNPTELLMSMVQDSVDLEEYLRLPLLPVAQKSPKSYSGTTASKSPFVLHVLQPLYNSTLASDGRPAAQYHPSMESMQGPDLEVTSDGHSLLQVLAEASNTPTNPATLVPLLQVLSAAAEIFPSGSCWTSSCQPSCWWRLQAVKELKIHSQQVLASTPGDLAAIVHVLARVLKCNGGASGDTNIQRWAILCLMNLTHATAAQSLFQNGCSETLSPLKAPWRHVWSVLFRSDQRYSGLTKDPTPGSVGDLMVQLLKEMAQHFCTDPGMTLLSSTQSRQSSFIYNQQADVWNLPVFWNPLLPDSTACFDLIHTLVFCVGLSERGADMICQSLPSDECFNLAGVNLLRRCKLVNFCLQALGSVSHECTIAAITMCLACLVYGSTQPEGIASDRSRHLLHKEKRYLAISNPDHHPLTLLRWPLSMSLHLLWTDPPSASDIKPTNKFLVDEICSDSSKLIHLLILKALESAIMTSTGADFIASSHSEVILSLCYEQLSIILPKRSPVSFGKATSQSPTKGVVSTPMGCLPLALRSLTMKVGLNLALYQTSTIDPFLLKVEKELEYLLSSALSLLESNPEEGDVVVVFSHVWQITQSLIESASEGCTLPDSFMKARTPLCLTIQDLLDEYQTRGDADQFDVSQQAKERQAKPHYDDGLSESDGGGSDSDFSDEFRYPGRKNGGDAENAGIAGGRKRKRMNLEPEARQRKSSKCAGASGSLSQVVAFLLASVLVGIDSSAKVSQNVAKSLLGVDDILHFDEADIDSLGAAFTCRLLCSESVFLCQASSLDYSEATQGRTYKDASIVSLIGGILKCLRATEIPDIALHCFCFQCCCKLVSLASSVTQGISISSDEANLITELLLQGAHDIDRQSLWLRLRPQLRATQVSAAADSFLFATQDLQSQFVKEYPSFVLKFLPDVEGVVRRQSHWAIGAAIQVLTETMKVIKSVRKHLPPLSVDMSAEDARKAYRVWLDSRRGLPMTGEAHDTSEEQVWEDAFLSIEYGVADCWITIACAAASTTTNEVVLSILYDFTKLSCSRPEHELVSFQAVDYIALALGYEEAEAFLDAECNSILYHWLQEGKHSLTLMPLLVSAPKVLCHLIAWGKLFPEHSAFWGERGIDTDSVKETAATEFMYRSRHSIIPLVVLFCVSKLSETSIREAGGPCLFEDQYMRDISSIFEVDQNDYNIDVVRRVIKKHFEDIIALQALLSCGSELQQIDSSKMDLLLRTLLSEDSIQSLKEKNAAASIKRCIEFGTQLIPVESDTEYVHLCSGAILALIEQGGDDIQDGCGDLFRQVQSTASEFFLLAKYHLTNKAVSSQIKKRYAAIEALCGIVIQQLSSPNGLNIAFYVHVLSALLFDGNLAVIHPSVITSIKELVHEAALRCEKSRILKDELRLLAKDLLCTLMHLHEQCQKSYISDCIEAQEKAQKVQRQQLSFLFDQSLDSYAASFGQGKPTLQSALLEYEQNSLNQGLIRILTGTYGIIQELIKYADKIGLSSEDFVGAAPPYETPSLYIESLAAVDSSFSAQCLVSSFLEDQEISTPALKFLDDAKKGDKVHRHSPTQQRILKAEMKKLQNFISDDGGEALKELVGMETAVRALAIYCGSQYCEEVSLAASHCLGELGPQLFEASLHSLPIEVGDSPIDDAIKNGQLELALFSQCAEDLVLCLKASSTSNTALVALATLKAFVSCKHGTEWKKYFQDEEATRLLSSFLGTRQSQLRLTDLFLTEREVQGLCQSFVDIDTSGNSWCWNKELWRIGPLGSTGFDKWICVVVPAILVLCYPKPTDSRECFNQELCLPLCQRISCINPDFACTIFPAVILDLLARSRQSEAKKSAETEGVLGDTYIGQGDSEINKHISTCFTALLESGRSNKTSCSRAVTLILDTLDCFRKLTQSNFKASTKHCKNPATSSSKGKEADASLNSSERENEDPKTWRGVPYGTILRLDGLLVASACLNANRPASAIFFAEMYANSRLGGSSSINEKLLSIGSAPQQNSSSDISGFAASESKLGTKQEIEKEGLNLLQVLFRCYSLLGEESALKSVQEHIADLQFTIDQNPPTMLTTPGNQHHTLSSLMQLDNVSSQLGHTPNLALSTASCLHGLGLKNVSQAYIQGVFSDSTADFCCTAGKELRDKWFECSLGLLQWNDPLFQSSDQTQSNPWNTALAGHHRGLGKLASHQAQTGFYEQIIDALRAISEDDYELCQVKVNQARKLLLHQVASAVHVEIPSSTPAGLFACTGRLQSLNQLDLIVRGSSPITDTLKLYSPTSACSQDRTAISTAISSYRPQSSAPSELGECLKELTLRLMHTKAKREGKEEEASLLLEALIMQLWNASEMQCLFGHSIGATGALVRLRSLCHLSSVQSSKLLLRVRLQEAKVLELQGDFTGAIRQAIQVVSHLEGETVDNTESTTERDSLLSEALVTCGHWMGKHKVEPADSILQGYLQPGAKLSVSVYTAQMDKTSSHCATSAHLELSRLAYSLFETVSSRTASAEWRKAGRILSERELELQQCDVLIAEQQKRHKAARKQSKDFKDSASKLLEYSSYRTSLGRQVDNAKGERLKIEKSMGEYRKLSLQSTVSALSIASTGSQDELSSYVYRMVSLWFSSQGTEQHQAVNSILSDAVGRVPSFRFVPLAAQLFSRLGQDGRSTNEFSNVLLQLLFTMCFDHPYHCLVQLIYASNGKRVGLGVSGRNASAFLDNASSSKVEQASSLLNKLKQEDDFTCSLVENYQMVTSAYIHLALAPTESLPRGEAIQFSKVCKASGERLDQCLGSGSRRRGAFLPCILTRPPAIDPSGDYNRDGDLGPEGSELIQGFEKSFTIAAGGISRPRIVKCLGSRGGEFKELVKGHDEIRQDAVMEQLFGYVNELMAKKTGAGEHRAKPHAESDRFSSRGRLRVVTYNIIPLSPASGVLEWVDDTAPFFDCIIDRGSRKSRVGIHSRYYPGEWSHPRCSKHFQASEPNAKRETFDDVCRFYSPCFRFFFVERFGHSMQAWYAAKTGYARSVAVSSIVGHVLGIGDRHGSNILVHEKSGEVVHIDFGIVFEQGKLLNIPEKVPFRLTRNIVDGLGPMGTEGLFTKACEETLVVLKRNAGALLTILSAVVADPLYTWSMSPVKARERQRLVEQDENDGDNGDDEGRATTTSGTATAGSGDELLADQNEAAATAISKIQEKLNGYEDGTSGEQQSVEGQIQLLINSARDPDHLCEMFHGWGPWV